MNAYFVRTRLQCLIAMNIQQKMHQNERYVVVFLYQKSREEDSAAVYALYKKFEGASSLSFHLVTGDGFLRHLLKIFLVMNLSALIRGACYLASINSLPFALVLRICPWIRLKTFDDGAANILRTSRYFTGRSALRSGWRNFVIDALFADGWVSWMRQRTTLHHTIFPFCENIVESNRLTTLILDWESLLVSADVELLNKPIFTIVLGTSFTDTALFESVSGISQELAAVADLYILHPREALIPEGRNVISFQSPAEAVLLHLSKKNRIMVLHFNSTVAYTLRDERDIDFRNLIDPITYGILKDIPALEKFRSLDKPIF